MLELPAEDREYLEERMRQKSYRKNHSVFTEYSLPTGIFYLEQGKVKKYKVDSDGREQIIYIYTSGEFFGYSALLGEQSYGDTAVAIEDSVICYISKEDFEVILADSKVLSRLLLKSLSHEFSVLANLMAVFSQRTVRERIALSLLILQDKYKENQNSEMLISLSRSDLANMAGTVLETLARVLHDFKSEGIIETLGRKIKILDRDKLYHIARFV